MSANLDFAEQVHVVSGILPIDMATGANTGDWVSLKNYSRVTVLFFKNVGQAAQDPTITFQQALDVSGGTPIDLDVIDKVYVKQATNLLATGTFTVATQTANNTYTEATAGEKALIWAIDFYADDLDIANSYDCFRVTIADMGTDTPNTPFAAVLYLLWSPRYGEQALVSAIVD